MIIPAPDPIAFSIYNFHIYWYGIILACAVLVGILYANNESKKYSLPHDFWIENSTVVILIGIIGARLYYCLINFGYYFYNPINIFDIRQGGLSIHGMLFAGILYFLAIAKIKKIKFWDLTDSVACALPLAQSIGRWGNYFNSEAFGIPTNGNWGLYIPQQNRPELYINYELFHPAFLYESIANLLIFGILVIISKKTKLRAGTLTIIYLCLYSLVRIFTEAIRIDSSLDIGNIHIAQIISVMVILISLTVIIIRRHN